MFVRSLDQAQQLMESVRPEELDLPTPCTEYDVRTLLGHLLTVVGRIPFDAVVPVSDDAASYDQLVAWQGRQP